MPLILYKDADDAVIYDSQAWEYRYKTFETLKDISTYLNWLADICSGDIIYEMSNPIYGKIDMRFVIKFRIQQDSDRIMWDLYQS